METAPVHVIELKRQLVSDIGSVEKLTNLSNDQLKAEQQKTELTLKTLESTLQKIQDPGYLKRVINKQHKLERKKKGRKRHAENAQRRRIQVEQRREKLHADIDRWQQEVRQQEKQRIQQQKTEHLTSLSKKSKLHDLSKLVEKLAQLRNIRRKRLEAKGHFFAEDGNDFFEQVKSWNVTRENQQLFEQENYDNGTQQSKEKALYIHPDDKWNDNKNVLDLKAYTYWSQGIQNTDTLRRIRNQWDCYNINSDDSSTKEHKIPPIWVPPAPPSNWIWASYLLNQQSK
ncbi:hypothetical protein BDC45DRAFT_277352 [Circinella umbellata]|nr:hypothetical protein BDC45DRAFT_277352 [Circinella umbellata]